MANPRTSPYTGLLSWLVSLVSAGGLGQWSAPIEFPLVPVAAALIYSSGDLLVWSAFTNNNWGIAKSGKTKTAIWNPGTNKITATTVSNTNHDMFCPGISLDARGRIVVTGGDTAEKTSIFDNGKWIQGVNMRRPRGYQSSATCSDGRIFVIGGSWSGGRGGKNGEIMDTKGGWSLLPGAPVAPMLTDDKQGVLRSDSHAWLFGWKRGFVFQAGPSNDMNWYSTAGKGNVKSAGKRGTDSDAMCGTATMYDAAEGLILTTGGAEDYVEGRATTNAHIINIDDAQAPAKVQKLRGMWFPRVFHNAVVLPDGHVFINGGQRKSMPFTDDAPILTPEIWDPVTKNFNKLLPNKIPRTYHSISILLPDARVFTGGGGLCGDCKTNHPDAEIFSPPYLFTADGKRLAPRPQIVVVSTIRVKAGNELIVTTKRGPNVVQMSLVRMGSVTHTVNTDQRRIVLTGQRSKDGTVHYLDMPKDYGVLLPGYWMLFAIDDAGTPSVATIIQVVL